MNFRNDINGLRAFAVLAVTLFHFGIPGVKGGFVGVDIFFVISGYLMTGIIFKKVDQGNFSLLGFYLDRARRIIPALAFLCLVVLLAGWFLLAPSEYKALGKHAASSVGFISNLIFWRESGYFDAASHEKWLLHTWSLSVEWQFYLLYPLIILFLRKWLAKSRTRWFLIIFTVLSFLLSTYLSNPSKSPTAAFYLLPTRAWEMLAGALVYLFPITITKHSRLIMEWSGLSLIAFSIIHFSASNIWPGWLAAIPVIGAILIIMSARNDSLLTGNPVAQFLGKISYSVYLWHWPLVAALNYFDKIDQAAWIASGGVASLTLGYLSFTLVENPMRSLGKQGATSRSFIYQGQLQLSSMVVVIVALGGGIFLLKGLPGNVREINSDARFLFVEKYDDMHLNGLYEAYRSECDFYDWKTKVSKKTIDPSCTNVGVNNTIFLWGDSHAQALSLGLRSFFTRRNVVAQVATSACRPSLGSQNIKATIDNNCDYSNQYALSQIARLKPMVVVMAQSESHENTDWDAIANYLYSLGVKKIVLVGPMPNWKPSLPLVMVRKHWGDNNPYIKDGLDSNVFDTDAKLERKYGNSNKITYISMIKYLCGNTGCLAVVPNDKSLMVVDYGHLSPPGSIYVAKKILGEKLNGLITATKITKAGVAKHNGKARI